VIVMANRLGQNPLGWMDQETTEPKTETKTEKEKETEKKATTPTTKAGLTQRGYYITKEQYKAIKRLAVETDRDTSELVREALDMYLKSKNINL